MTDPNHTHISFLLDRSGSMQSIKSDTIGGFGAFIDEQKGEPGRCTVSLAQFDDHYDEVYHRLPLDQVPELDLQPRGMTAMLDAIGRLVVTTGQQLAALPEEERPGTVIVGIMTDGLENSSKEFTRAKVREMIQHQTDVYGWQFMYLGANQDAVEVGTGLGVDPGMSLTYTQSAAGAAMRLSGQKLSGLRRRMAAGMAPEAARAASVYTEAERDEAAGRG